MKRGWRVSLSVICFLLMLVGPAMRAFGEMSVYYYLVSVAGLIGLLAVDWFWKKSSRT
ncbi:MAG: hypothetical protein LRY73_01140 [Bacillus sp. (in: Bacteria)]|nr:hypothetical protein [Bacillus sp. (in: firmicutes)]